MHVLAMLERTVYSPNYIYVYVSTYCTCTCTCIILYSTSKCVFGAAVSLRIWNVTLTQITPHSQSIFVTKIASGGLAEQDGRLRLGDKLLKVWNLYEPFFFQ